MEPLITMIYQSIVRNCVCVCGEKCLIVCEYNHFSDSPRILGNTKNKFGSFLLEYTLDCPLQSNPPPNCFWEVVHLSYEFTLIDNPFGVHYSGDGGCTLVIESLTLNYTHIVFNCTATNELGSKIFSFNSIDFNSKLLTQISNTHHSIPLTACSQDQTAILSPQPSEGSTLFLSKGQNVTLSCIITKVSIGTYQVWTINATNNTLDYVVGDNYTNDYELCTQTMTLNLQDVSYNDSGTYTCVYYTYSRDPDKRLGSISLNILVVDEEGMCKILGQHTYIHCLLLYTHSCIQANYKYQALMEVIRM